MGDHYCCKRCGLRYDDCRCVPLNSSTMEPMPAQPTGRMVCAGDNQQQVPKKAEVSLFDKIRTAREGSTVERCHAHPHSMRYTTGQHSLDLLTLLVFAWQEEHGGALPRAELLVAAAAHDLPERLVGDVPSPIKDLIGGRLEEAEDKMLSTLGLNPALTEEEELWLRVADRVELYLWCCEEAGCRGNVYFWTWVDEYDLSFKKNPPPAVFNTIMFQARLNGGARMDFTKLKEMAGL